jgi:hypothetical protein
MRTYPVAGLGKYSTANTGKDGCYYGFEVGYRTDSRLAFRWNEAG